MMKNIFCRKPGDLFQFLYFVDIFQKHLLCLFLFQAENSMIE